MLTNIAEAQMTPNAFIAAGSARLGVGARSVAPSRLELVVETVIAVPYRGRAIQPSAGKTKMPARRDEIRYNSLRPRPGATLPPAPQTSHDDDALAAAQRDRCRTSWVAGSGGAVADVESADGRGRAMRRSLPRLGLGYGRG